METVLPWWNGQTGSGKLPEERLDIYIGRLAEAEECRKLKLAPRGERYRRLVEELMDVACAGNRNCDTGCFGSRGI